MYDKMRAEILRELMNAGIDPDAVIPCIDRVAVRYTVAERVGSTQSALEVLESYLACRKFEKLAEGTLYNYRVFLSRMLETIGLPLSEITSALRNGMQVEEIRELLGHENIETTMVYAKASGESVQSSHRKYVV